MNRNIEMKISELRPRIKNIRLRFKVLEKEDVADVKSRKNNLQHKVMDVLIGDETGMLFLTLWDENIDDIHQDKLYEISNAYTSIFKGTIRLNIGKYGHIKEINDPEFKVDKSKNFSEDVYEKYDLKRRRERNIYGSGSFWRD